MSGFNELKLLVNDVTYSGQQSKYNKYEVYNTLLQMNQSIREECINNINEEYGFELVDKYDFARYEISINNSKEVVDMPTLFTPTFTINETDYYRDQMKELQKGYMKLLTSQAN